MKLLRSTLAVGMLIVGAATMNAQIVVQVKPTPPAKRVVKPMKAKPGHVWVDGHWRYNNKTNRYEWVTGHWVKARKGHRWVPGHWVDVPGKGHKWVPGHWKRV